jgi:hypothetical protein
MDCGRAQVPPPKCACPPIEAGYESSESAQTTAIRKYASPQEFAKISGLSLATIHRRLKNNELPKWQPGGRGCRVLIPLDEIESGRLEPEANVAAVSTPALTNSVAPQSKRQTRRGPTPKWKQLPL